MKLCSIPVGLGAALALFAQSTPPGPTRGAAHPDLNGTWDNGSGIDFIQPQHLAGGSVCVSGCDTPAPAKATATTATPAAAARPPRNFPKYRAQYLAKVAQLEKNQLQADPVLHCRAPGLPRIG